MSKFLHGQSDSVFTSSANDIEPEKPSMIPVPIAPNSPLKSILKKPIQQVTLEVLSDKMNFLEETIQNNTDHIISQIKQEVIIKLENQHKDQYMLLKDLIIQQVGKLAVIEGSVDSHANYALNHAANHKIDIMEKLTTLINQIAVPFLLVYKKSPKDLTTLKTTSMDTKLHQKLKLVIPHLNITIPFTRGDFMAPVGGCHCITHYPFLV